MQLDRFGVFKLVSGIDFPEVKHSLDVWHKAAKVMKALIKASTQKLHLLDQAPCHNSMSWHTLEKRDIMTAKTVC